MFDFLRPIASRILGGLIGAAAGFVATKTRGMVSLTPSDQLVIVGGTITIVGGVVHKLIDKYVNPADSASKHLALEGVIAASEAKVQQDMPTIGKK